MSETKRHVMSLRLDRDVRERLEEDARERGLSVNDLITEMLAKRYKLPPRLRGARRGWPREAKEAR